MARGRGDIGGFTVPAINVRVMAYDTARAIFRTAMAGRPGRIILEIARSEIAYTEQRPAEYVSVMIGAALREGYTLPALHPGRPLPGQPQEVPGRSRGRGGRGEEAHRRGDRRGLLQHRRRHLDAGGPLARRRWRSSSARTTSARRRSPAFIRGRSRAGVTVSVGGEIGEVGMKNSTVEELHAFMQGYNRSAVRARQARRASARSRCRPARRTAAWCCRTARIADVKLDLEALEAAQQGGARGVRAGRGGAARCEHAALQRVRQLPANRDGRDPPRHQLPEHRLRPSQTAGGPEAADPDWLDENAAGERKSGDTDEQFYYKARKKAIGPFKRELWGLPEDIRTAIAADLERTFAFLFEQLNVNGTTDHINRIVQAPLQHHAALKPVLVAAADDPDAGE